LSAVVEQVQSVAIEAKHHGVRRTRRRGEVERDGAQEPTVL
jgi:hypothetical protein